MLKPQAQDAGPLPQAPALVPAPNSAPNPALADSATPSSAGEAADQGARQAPKRVWFAAEGSGAGSNAAAAEPCAAAPAAKKQRCVVLRVRVGTLNPSLSLFYGHFQKPCSRM